MQFLNAGMSMTAPKSDFVTAPQHHYSESRWSQHSETALKVQNPKSGPWPTDYLLWRVPRLGLTSLIYSSTAWCLLQYRGNKKFNLECE